MTVPNPAPPGAGGGSVATRGLLVQTLVALLEVAQTESSFTEITLEPVVGNEKFDFLWKNKDGSYATQVKSTINSFTRSDVEQWAGKLEAARSTENCCLILVGNITPSLDGIDQIGAVKIEKRNLCLADLHEQAAHRLSKFLEAEGMHAGTALQREMVVRALVSKLEDLATKSERLTREAFINLLRQWINTAPKGEVKIDVSRIFKYAPAELIGRESETNILYDAWLQVVRGEPKRPRILTFVALGGEGKTSLVAKWAAELAHQDWPGCDVAFAWSFYSQGTREQMAASSDLFLKEALTFFGDDADKEFAASPASAFEKGQRLARIVGQRHSILILDGLEPLQYAPTSPTPGELKDQGIAALLKTLATASHGLCIITTRFSVWNLKALWQTTAPEMKLLRLSTSAGVKLLRTLGVKIGSQTEFEKLVEDVKGHALTLTLLGTYLRDAHVGDIRKRDLVKLEEADVEEQGGHAFRVMEAYEYAFEHEGDKGKRALAILRLLGLFDRPMTADCFDALLKTPAIPAITEPLVGLGEAQLNIVLTRLESAKLISAHSDDSSARQTQIVNCKSVDAHPLVREYFARKLRGQHPNSWRAAHRRLYEHLTTTTPDKSHPTLEDLQPLYQAVAHGCEAGRHQSTLWKLYYDRIQRQNNYYATNTTGAFGSDLGALASFFEEVWKQPARSLNQRTQVFLCRQSAFSLRAAGRLAEAMSLAKVALQIASTINDWKGATISAGLVSALNLLLGNIVEALQFGADAVHLSGKTVELDRHVASRCDFANALLQAGKAPESLRLFQEAEAIEAKQLPQIRLLRSIQGFAYHELLLREAERAAWLCFLSRISASTLQIQPSVAHSCKEVECRASRTLTFEEEKSDSILSIEINKLTLGRTALYESLITSCAQVPQSRTFNQKTKLTQTSVAGLCRAGQQHFVPLALLTRAWLRFLTGARTGPESAQADLDEAWEIAERGPMRLHLADIHLYRARLFFREKAYRWKSPQDDLAAAEKLINECGYHRRDVELADAKRAILGT